MKIIYNSWGRIETQVDLDVEISEYDVSTPEGQLKIQVAKEYFSKTAREVPDQLVELVLALRRITETTEQILRDEYER